MPEANNAAPRAVESAAPSVPLADELKQVVVSAGELRQALDGLNFRSEDFPHDDLNNIITQLEASLGLTREGARDALNYAFRKLSQLRRRAVPAADTGKGDLAGVGRGGAVDNALSHLIAAASTAYECYSEPEQARAEQSSISERLVITGNPAKPKELAEQASQLAKQTGAIAKELAEEAKPGATRADNLVRGVRSVAVLKGLEHVELGGFQPHLRLLDLLNGGVKRAVQYVRSALRAVQVGADIGKVVFDKAHHILVGVWFEQIKKGSEEIENLIDEYERRWSAAGGGRERPLRSLDVFRDRLKDGTAGPEMIVIPAGSFLMGSPESDEEAYDDEKPQRRVTIPRAFALARTPVTFEDYDRFCAATNRGPPEDEGWGRGRRPVINVTWDDAKEFCGWLSRETGAVYRLPAEAEWEYACRAGSETRRWWGDEWDATKANGAGEVGKTTEVADYPPNPWGLCDTLGNVWEWCEDHYEERVGKLPRDGSAYVAKRKDVPRVARGGSWSSNPRNLRCAVRVSRYGADDRDSNLGFRLARTL